MRHCVAVFLGAVILVASSFGQNSIAVQPGPGFSGSAHFGAPMPFAMRAVTGAPYSAEEVVEQVQTLADGTHISQKPLSTKVYRDSLGRTRTDKPLFRGMAVEGASSDSALIVEITDPVAQVKYTLDTANKIAHRQQLTASPDAARRVPGVAPAAVPPSGLLAARIMPAPGLTTGVLSQTLPAAVTPSQQVRPEMTREELGSQTIEGVLAAGTRNTTTWPVSSQGNDRPISVVSEFWMSPELKVMILSKSNDPRWGEHIQKLTNISRSEPSASLFQPPPEYTVVDEKGEFTISWGSRQ